MASTYTVKHGDNLTKIAKAYGTTVSALVKANDITDANYIVVDQVIKIPSGNYTKPSSKTTGNQAVIKAFGLQSNTTRTVYATWNWSKDKTEHYKVKWTYSTGDGVAFIGEETTVTAKQSLYNAPENAVSVCFYVKPISKTRKVNDRETNYWTASWSTVKKYYFSKNPPSTPPTPKVETQDYTLTAELDNLDVNATHIQFQIVQDDTRVFKTGTAMIKTKHASYSCTVDAGSEYKVRCRSIREEFYSGWSEYSENVETIPDPSKGILTAKALSSTSVYLDWSNVKNAKEYEVQYTTQKRYFDSSNEVQSMTVDATAAGHAEVTGLETGTEWFFRVRVKNDKGGSAWTDIVSVKLGSKPSIPTTWASSTTVTVGKPVTLYWVHNSEDNSSQTYAQLELNIGGQVTTKTIKNSTAEDEKDKTSTYVIDTTGYTGGTKILWRVKTKGSIDTYSDWSIQRTIDIYAPPTLSLDVTDSSGNPLETLTSFPFYLTCIAGPAAQTPIGYYVSIVANEMYEGVDNRGDPKVIKAGQSVYSKYFDTDTMESVMFSANNVDLENNISYTMIVTVSMNSGLTAESSHDFTVAWIDIAYPPDAEIGYDPATYTTSIRPYCIDEDDRLINGVTLSVYRREYDGSFTELATGLNNMSQTFITDPHPALDYARYRVVASTDSTGAIEFSDIAPYPVQEKAVIIQWDEAWSNFETDSEDALEKPSWSGSLLRLPYNIDVSDTHSKDSTLVEYIGREHPVAYYGTQLGQSSTWNVEIEKSDKETLYALRRLARWMGDVYVREPSGSGYWASIDVSFNQRHCVLTIPVTINVTRVSGGA